MGLLNFVRSNRLSSRRFAKPSSAAPACPPAMIDAFEDEFGVTVLHAWGMTEFRPWAACAASSANILICQRPPGAPCKQKQGKAIFGMEMKIVDGEGRALPHDDLAFGDLMVRGPWVVERYFRDDKTRAGGRLVSHRRRGASMRTATDHHRSLEGCHQVRRRVDQFNRH